MRPGELARPMLNGIGAGLGDARRFQEATLAVTRLWNDLRLAHG